MENEKISKEYSPKKTKNIIEKMTLKKNILL